MSQRQQQILQQQQQQRISEHKLSFSLPESMYEEILSTLENNKKLNDKKKPWQKPMPTNISAFIREALQMYIAKASGQ